MLENSSQHSFIDVPLDGARNNGLPVWHTLLPKERKLLRLWGTSTRKQNLWERDPTLHEGSCLGNFGRHLYACPFAMRLKQQYLIEPNAFIAKQVGRMRAADYLSPSSPLHCREKLRQVANDIRVQ